MIDLQALLAEAEPNGNEWEAMFVGGPLGRDVWEVGPEGGPPVAVCGTEAVANLIAAIPRLVRAEALQAAGEGWLQAHAKGVNQGRFA